MVINNFPGEQLADKFAAREIPIGEHLTYADMPVLDSRGHKISETRRDGILVGYETLGRQHLIVIQRRNEEGLPIGHPKSLPLSCLRKQVEVIEIAENNEAVSDPVQANGIFSFIGSKLV